jgi:hypothetical protein
LETFTVAIFLSLDFAVSVTLFHVFGVLTVSFVVWPAYKELAPFSLAVEAASADVTGTAVTTIAKARAEANTFLNVFMCFPLFPFLACTH